MATLEAIAAAIKEIDTKKQNLKKAYDDIQSHSSLLSSFSIDWSDLDAHFTHVQNSLNQRFHHLESLSSTQQPTTTRVDSALARPEVETTSTQLQSQAGPLVSMNPPSQDRPVRSFLAWPELKALCEKMDGIGLRKFINEKPKERELIRHELPESIRVAPDPGLMVLEAMEGFYGGNSNPEGNKEPGFCGIRRACVLLLEVLMGINVNIGSEVRERAKRVAFEWKEKVKLDEQSSLEVLGLLHLVAAYGLGCEFKKNDLVEYFVIVAKYRQSTLLCKAIGLGDNVQDVIQKLIKNGKHLLAVKYIFEFELTNKYPPVPLLEAYVKESNEMVMKVCEEEKNSLKLQNEAKSKEIGALKAVIKVIEEHKLDSEYPKENIEKRIEMIQKQIANRKRPAPTPPVTRAAARAAKPQAQQPQREPQQPKKKPQQSGNKRPRTNASVGQAPPSVAGANSTVRPFHIPPIQPAGSMPDNSALYMNSAAGPYGLEGTTPAVASYAGSSAVYMNSAAGPYGLEGTTPAVASYAGSSAPAVASYAGSSVGLYGLPGTPMGFPGNSNHATSQFYPTEQLMPSGYYESSTAYGGYGVPPQFYPSYYPQ